MKEREGKPNADCQSRSLMPSTSAGPSSLPWGLMGAGETGGGKRGWWGQARSMGAVSHRPHARVRQHQILEKPPGQIPSQQAPRVDVACRIKWCWRSSHLTVSLRSLQSWLPYGTTALTRAMWMAITHSATIPCILMSTCSWASPALAAYMHRLRCSLNVRWVFIQTPNHLVSSMLNWTKPFPTLISTVSYGWRCFLWPLLLVKSTASNFAVLNWTSHQLAHWMLSAV